MFNILIFIKIICFKHVWGFSWFVLGVLVSPKKEIVGFGARGHVQKSRNHINQCVEVLPQANRKVTSSNWSNIMSRSSWTYYFHKFTITIAHKSQKWQAFGFVRFFRAFYRNPLGLILVASCYGKTSGSKYALVGKALRPISLW